jgi:23S rRNA (uracil1939-C5)-methyltransferase
LIIDFDMDGTDPFGADEWNKEDAALGPLCVYQIVRKDTTAHRHISRNVDVVRLRIDRIVAGGAGIGFHEGRALIVEGTAPGDLVDATPPAKGPVAQLVGIVEPGPDRVVPECAYVGACGGCDFMHLSYDAQIRAKEQIVRDALRRTGGWEAPEDFRIVPSPEPFGSRIRATWHSGRTGRAGYNRPRSHDVVEVGACLVLDPLLEEARLNLRIAEDVSGLSNRSAVSLHGDDESANMIPFSVVGERIYGRADVFFQSNGALLETIVQDVLTATACTPESTVVDLYAGVGLFSVPLGRRAKSVMSVEANSDASWLAGHNREVARLTNIETRNETEISSSSGRVDFSR